MSLIDEVLTMYIDAQRTLIEFESVDNNSVLVSLPLRFSAYTRVELSITRVSENHFLLSDMGQTIGELKDAGYLVGHKLMGRITELTKIWNIDITGNTLVRTCTKKDLGRTLHEFGEAAKTVGDAYLTVRENKQADAKIEEDLKERIRQTFNDKHYFYKERETVPGNVEKAGHKIDFFIAPNGSNGLALEVLPNPNKLQAEAWGFRAQDMKRANNRLIVGFVFDITAKDLSRTILDSMADISLSSSEFVFLAQQLEEHQISKG
jgi:hypothetical protein